MCGPAARSHDAAPRLACRGAAWLGRVAACIGLPAHAEAPLRVCLQADDPPLSSRHAGDPGGFNVVLVRLLAERLDRPLEVQWFTTRDDPDSNPATEANALLSDGRCASSRIIRWWRTNLDGRAPRQGSFPHSKERSRRIAGAGSDWARSITRDRTGRTP